MHLRHSVKYMVLLVLQLAVTEAQNFSPIAAPVKLMPVLMCIQVLQRDRSRWLLSSLSAVAASSMPLTKCL